MMSELRQRLEAEKRRAVDEAKKKQWCAQCGSEAIYYCCWNTAYCDHPCQQLHWSKHMQTCANANQVHLVRPPKPLDSALTPLGSVPPVGLAEPSPASFNLDATSLANESLRRASYP